jgi:hypothetical protein
VGLLCELAPPLEEGEPTSLPLELHPARTTRPPGSLSSL